MLGKELIEQTALCRIRIDWIEVSREARRRDDEVRLLGPESEFRLDIIVDVWLLDEDHPVSLGGSGQQVLRPLEDEIPPQMREA